MRRATRTVLPLLRPSTSLLLPSRPLHTLRKPLPPRRPVSSPFRRYSTPDTSPSSSTPTSTKACPACGSPLDLREISCAECGALSPLPENINYLTLFNISAEKPFKFDIDVGQLRREYLKLMSKVHPDSVISGSDEQKRIAENVSSTITHAYSTLQNPLSRAAYLLHHFQPPVPVTESTKLEDPELLMTVLEVREQIEEAQTPEEVEEIRRENMQRIESVKKKLSRAFEEGNATGARDGTVELRYWEGLRKACDSWEPGQRVELVHE